MEKLSTRDEKALALYPGAVSAVSGQGRRQGWRSRGLSVSHSLAVIQHKRRVGWYVENEVATKSVPTWREESQCWEQKRKNQRNPSGRCRLQNGRAQASAGRLVGYEEQKGDSLERLWVLSVSTRHGCCRGGAAPEESKDKVTDKQEEPENFINETYMFHSVILKASLLLHCLHTGRQSLRTQGRVTVVTRGPRTGVNTSLTTGQITTRVLLIYIAFPVNFGSIRTIWFIVYRLHKHSFFQV